MTRKVTAAWLPQAAQRITVVWTHPDYDTTSQRVLVARDWLSRGEDYIRERAGLDPQTLVVAVFEGEHRSLMGAAIND